MNDLRTITAMIYAGYCANPSMSGDIDFPSCVGEAQAIIDATPDPVDVQNHEQCANANMGICQYGSKPFGANQMTRWYCKGCNGTLGENNG